MTEQTNQEPKLASEMLRITADNYSKFMIGLAVHMEKLEAHIAKLEKRIMELEDNDDLK